MSDLNQKEFLFLNILVSIAPLGFCMFFPQIGIVISIAGAVCGFLMIYIVPVITYLKMKKIEIEYPLLAAAIQENEVQLIMPEREHSTRESNDLNEGSTGGRMIGNQDGNFISSPKLVITDRFL